MQGLYHYGLDWFFNRARYSQSQAAKSKRRRLFLFPDQSRFGHHAILQWLRQKKTQSGTLGLPCGIGRTIKPVKNKRRVIWVNSRAFIAYTDDDVVSTTLRRNVNPAGGEYFIELDTRFEINWLSLISSARITGRFGWIVVVI
jgi:hypothetical protein